MNWIKVRLIAGLEVKVIATATWNYMSGGSVINGFEITRKSI